ncbi:MAG: lysophospholipase [Clostridia bacterium]|nr:lysophospholipase [Clostridia bacterium]
MDSVYTVHRDTYLSADAKHTIVYYVYIPKNREPRAIVQISHGMCEYIGRYEPFAAFLCEKGYVVAGNDHVGHGASAANEADLGFTSGAENLVDDVHMLTERLKNEYRGLPLVLLGHSMGSFVARRYLEKYPGAADAAIISGTGGPDSPTGFGKLLTKTMMLFKGERYRSELVKSIAFMGYNKHFEAENCKDAWISRDREIVERYGKDPLCQFTFTLKGYYDLFDLLGKVSDKAWAGNLKKDLPILMISGEDDPVGAYGVGVRKIYDRLTRAQMTDVSLRLYAGARHEMLNETNRVKVFADIAAWLEQKI